MARSLRLQFRGALYHVTSRGDRRLPIFADAHDRRKFIDKLAQVVVDCRWRVFAYVLMPNHYHLLLGTPRPNLSAGMQRFQTSYSTYYRVRHEISGHVFGGRFKARIVEGDSYLLALARYVHLNPVKTEDVRAQPLPERLRVLRSFPWSSYPGYCYEDRREEWVEYEPLLALCADAGGRAGFRGYVEAGVAKDDEELLAAMSVSGKAIGSLPFLLRAEAQHAESLDKLRIPADVSVRRVEATLAPEKIVDAVCAQFGVVPDNLLGRPRNTEPRDVLIHALRDLGGLSCREIGRMLGHGDGSAVGRRWAVLRQDGAHGRTWEALSESLSTACLNREIQP